MRVFKDIAYKNEEACKLDMYLPDEDGFETIVWFHGGGLENGDKQQAERFVSAIVDAGYGFISANYRMYTNGVKFPEFLFDAAAAVAFVKEKVETYGGQKEKLYISGQSAGAWLSLMLCVNDKYLKSVGMQNNEIAGWIIDSSQTTSHFNVLKYELGEDTRAQRINEFAPQYFISDKTEFSKMLLLFYEEDMCCRYEQNMLFYKSILAFNEQANVSYKVLPGWHCHGSSEPSEDGKYDYVETMLAWLKN